MWSRRFFFPATANNKSSTSDPAKYICNKCWQFLSKFSVKHIPLIKDVQAFLRFKMYSIIWLRLEHITYQITSGHVFLPIPNIPAFFLYALWLRLIKSYVFNISSKTKFINMQRLAYMREGRFLKLHSKIGSIFYNRVAYTYRKMGMILKVLYAKVYY